MNGYDLYDGVPPHTRDSGTSLAAAVAVIPRVHKMRQVVLDYLETCGAEGATDDDVFVAHPQDSQNTLRARRVELVQLGLVNNTGRTKVTRWNRHATVWVHHRFGERSNDVRQVDSTALCA